MAVHLSASTLLSALPRGLVLDYLQRPSVDDPRIAEQEALRVLHPAERTLLPKTVHPRRLQSFTWGRRAAHASLAQLQVGGEAILNGPLLRDQRGAVRWPADVLGSVTHWHDVSCLAAADGQERRRTLHVAAIAGRKEHYRGLGIDLTGCYPWDERRWRRILRPEERAAFAAKGKAEQAELFLALCFAAKESIYKAAQGMHPQYLGFQDALLGGLQPSMATAGEAKFHWQLTVAHPALARDARQQGVVLWQDGLVFAATWIRT